MVEAANRLHERLRAATLEIEAIPDSVIREEYARRFGNGRPKVLRPCRICGAMKGAREMQAHLKSHTKSEKPRRKRGGLGKRLKDIE